MIDMSKKYRTRDGRAVRLLCVDGFKDDWRVVGIIAGDSLASYWNIEGRYSRNGYAKESDLIEVVPDVVTWARVYVSGAVGPPSDEIQTPGMAVAFLRTTIRNGGKSHTDVTVDVLPVDYVEPTP